MSEAFPKISKVTYEGKTTKNPFAYKFYNPDQMVEGKTMKDHLRFSCVYWHTMRGNGSDPFGVGTALRPWEDGTNSVTNALKRADVFFEICQKLQLPYYAFHDRDVAPEGNTLKECNANFDKVAAHMKELQSTTGVKLLWGTASLFTNARYVHGAATSSNADVFAFAAGQVKKALEVTKELGGEGYVFWGGREGYALLHNTDMKRELDNLSRFLHMAVDYAKKIGFKGAFYIEPKPKEPSTHQYDSDAAACLNFLRQYDLLKDFKLNIENNHATLAGHSFCHELQTCIDAKALGSIDANSGDPLLGWDTDEFPYDITQTALAMLTILNGGGLTTGGVNFDAKVRRASFTPEDLLHAHILGVDTYARALTIAAAIRADGGLKDIVEERYTSWNSGVGKEIEGGKSNFENLERYVFEKEAANGLSDNISGSQERILSYINSFV